MTTRGSDKELSRRLAAALSALEHPDQAEALLREVLRQYTAGLTPPQALQFTRKVSDSAKKRSAEISGALIASVNGKPGKYPGFTVVEVAGRASVSTEILHDQFPEAYAAAVSWGAHYQTVRIPGSTGDDTEQIPPPEYPGISAVVPTRSLGVMTGVAMDVEHSGSQRAGNPPCPRPDFPWAESSPS